MLKEKLLTLRELGYSRKYEILLVSFFVLISGDIFFYNDFDGTPILIIQNVLAGIVFFSGKTRSRLLLLFLLTSMVVLEVINLIVGFSQIDVVFAIFYIIYSALLSVVVYGEITPYTSLAKNAAVFFGLIGHFYSVVVIGVIIGKYLSKSD